MAEVKACLYQFGDFCLDPNRRVLLRSGEPVALTPKALDTLHALVRQSGRVVGKDEFATGLYWLRIL
jgi:DNA-binding winged helix-turn-helix (wHTH) protein